MGHCIITIPEIKGESNMIIFSNNSDSFITYLLTAKEIILYKLFQKGTYDFFTWVEEIKKATEAPNYCSWRGYTYKEIIKDSDTKTIAKVVKAWNRDYNQQAFINNLKTAIRLIKTSPIYYDDTFNRHREYLQFLNECGLEDLVVLINRPIKS